MNPLGVRALYLGSSMYRIHGTDAPWTIGTSASSGCIRLYNEDVLDLYPRVRVGAKVTVTYAKFTTSGAVSTATTSSTKSSGGIFDMFGSSDDEPEQKAKRPRAKRKTSDKSAASGKAVERTETTAEARNTAAATVSAAAASK
jgi:hypothetical protein